MGHINLKLKCQSTTKSATFVSLETASFSAFKACLTPANSIYTNINDHFCLYCIYRQKQTSHSGSFHKSLQLPYKSNTCGLGIPNQ